MDKQNESEGKQEILKECQAQEKNSTVRITFLDNSGGYDLTMIVEDQKINVCRTVLCVASPVFQAMLKSDFKEKDQMEIELPGKKYEDFVEFLSCFYPDKLKYLTEENVYRVIPLALEYQVKVLEDRGHKLLVQLVQDKHTSNETEIYRHLQLAELYSFEELKDKCIQLASKLSLAKMDKGSSAHPVSDQAVLQIRYLALQMKEHVIDLNRGDDTYLFGSAKMAARQSGNAVRYSELVQNSIEILGRSYNNGTELLRAARLCARYFSTDRQLASNIISNLNSKGTYAFIQLKRELDLLPEEIKKDLIVL